jgi:hypothetical protein
MTTIRVDILSDEHVLSSIEVEIDPADERETLLDIEEALFDVFGMTGEESD